MDEEKKSRFISKEFNDVEKFIVALRGAEALGLRYVIRTNVDWEASLKKAYTSKLVRTWELSLIEDDEE